MILRFPLGFAGPTNFLPSGARGILLSPVSLPRPLKIFFSPALSSKLPSLKTYS